MEQLVIPGRLLLLVGALIASAKPVPSLAQEKPPWEIYRAWQNYEACVAKQDAEYIARCMRESLSADLERSRKDLPVLPTQAERAADCRANLAIAKGKARLFPGSAGECKRPKEQP